MTKRSEKMDGEREEQNMEGKWFTMVVKDMNDLTKSLCGPKEKKREAYFMINDFHD